MSYYTVQSPCRSINCVSDTPIFSPNHHTNLSPKFTNLTCFKITPRIFFAGSFFHSAWICPYFFHIHIYYMLLFNSTKHSVFSPMFILHGKDFRLISDVANKDHIVMNTCMHFSACVYTHAFCRIYLDAVIECIWPSSAFQGDAMCAFTAAGN